MKVMKKIMYFAAALLVLVGCQKSQEAKENAPANYGTITGKIELPQGPNKISAPTGWEEAETAFTMVWDAGDQIYIYNGSECKQLSNPTIVNGVATFEGELLTDMSSYNVAYGYDPSLDYKGEATYPTYPVPYIADNYRPFAEGAGAEYEFTIANFGPVIGLQLKGDGAFSKIEVALLNDSKATLATYTMTFEDALTLSAESVTKVYFPIQFNEDAVKIAISFYKKVNSEEVLALTKTTNMPEANKVTTFPVLTFQSAYEYVDLGLLSGLKWATCNVGATAPEGYGDYFAWGETSSKDVYKWSTYFDTKNEGDTFTKYKDGGKTTLDPENDAAHVNWGGNWRMPTSEEIEELINKCTWAPTQKNGVDGYEVKGSNGNSIFLPYSGERFESSLYDDGSFGYYWSSSIDWMASSSGGRLGVYSGGVVLSGHSRCDGLSVRPVVD